jgi:transposase-like protein
MADAMLDARQQEGGSYCGIEAITGQRRRRQWTAEEKARIVAESFEKVANISEVARRHGVGNWIEAAPRKAGRLMTSAKASSLACLRASGPDQRHLVKAVAFRATASRLAALTGCRRPGRG